jgi:transcriptional regulator with XRE-family HTH domain
VIVNREYIIDTKEYTKHAKMFSVETFGDWLLNELNKQGWSQNELAKRAGISHGTVSNIINGNKGVGQDSLIAIARALKLPADLVFRKAGLLPPAVDIDEAAEALLHKIMNLPPEKRKQVIDFLNFLETQQDFQDQQKVKTSRGKSRLELIKGK